MNPYALSLDIDFLICFSDTHCGSVFGLMPPRIELADGNEIRYNEIQRWMWRCWNLAWEWADQVTGGKKTAVACVGDAREGIHHGGNEILTTVGGDHNAIAVECIKPKVNGRRFLMSEGTECHTHRSESDIGKAFGAIPFKSPARKHGSMGVYSWPQVDLNVRGCGGIIRHHIAVATRPWTEGSGLSAQLGADRIEAARTDRKPPQFIVSGHRHRLGGFWDGDAEIATLPPWQALTRHGRKVVPAARLVVGMVVLDFRHADKHNPPQVLKRRYYT